MLFLIGPLLTPIYLGIGRAHRLLRRWVVTILWGHLTERREGWRASSLWFLNLQFIQFLIGETLPKKAISNFTWNFIKVNTQTWKCFVSKSNGRGGSFEELTSWYVNDWQWYHIKPTRKSRSNISLKISRLNFLPLLLRIWLKFK